LVQENGSDRGNRDPEPVGQIRNIPILSSAVTGKTSQRPNLGGLIGGQFSRASILAVAEDQPALQSGILGIVMLGSEK
jgi:hypothetical protein